MKASYLCLNIAFIHFVLIDLDCIFFQIVPFADCPCPILWQAGTDDHNYKSAWYGEEADRMAKEAGKTNLQLKLYQGMGHMANLPFTPGETYTTKVISVLPTCYYTW